MRIRFIRNYRFTPLGDRRVTTNYRTNMEITVKRVDGEIAVANGAAVEVDVPSRDRAPEVGTLPVVRRRRMTRAVPPPNIAIAPRKARTPPPETTPAPVEATGSAEARAAAIKGE